MRAIQDPVDAAKFAASVIAHRIRHERVWYFQLAVQVYRPKISGSGLSSCFWDRASLMHVTVLTGLKGLELL